MPQLGETVTEGTITRWLKQVGDPVEADEPLFEVSTDKVDSEVPAPSAGVVSEILVARGRDGRGRHPPRRARRARRGAAPAPAAPPAPEPAAAAPAPAPDARAAPRPEPAAGRPGSRAGAVPSAAEPVAVAAAPAGAGARAAAAAPEPGVEEPARALTSPIVRRLVAERGLDPSAITGTGAGGRLTRKDVLDAPRHPLRCPGAAPRPRRLPSRAARRARPAAPPAAAGARAPATGGPAAPAAPPLRRARPRPLRRPLRRTPPAGPRDEVVPFDNIRRRTAEHMVRSLATSAHVYTSVEVDFEGVERVRAAHRDEWKATEGFSLTYLPFIARGVLRRRERLAEGERERRRQRAGRAPRRPPRRSRSISITPASSRP